MLFQFYLISIQSATSIYIVLQNPEVVAYVIWHFAHTPLGNNFFKHHMTISDQGFASTNKEPRNEVSLSLRASLVSDLFRISSPSL